MKNLDRNQGKSKQCRLETFEPAPGVVVNGRIEKLEIRLIPALSKIAGTMAKNSEPSKSTYLPWRALFVSKNEDGTYFLFNRLELIEPDIARLTTKWVTAIVLNIDSTQEEQKSLLLEFLLTVDAARHCVSSAQLVDQLLAGQLENLASFYASARCEPNGWGMYRGFFSNNELPKPTFYRCKSGPKEKTSSPSGDTIESPLETGDETSLPEVDEEPKHLTTNEPPNSSSDTADSHPSNCDDVPLPEVDAKPRQENPTKELKGNQRDFIDELDKNDKTDKTDGTDGGDETG